LEKEVKSHTKVSWSLTGKPASHLNGPALSLKGKHFPMHKHALITEIGLYHDGETIFLICFVEFQHNGFRTAQSFVHLDWTTETKVFIAWMKEHHDLDTVSYQMAFTIPNMTVPLGSTLVIASKG